MTRSRSKGSRLSPGAGPTATRRSCTCSTVYREPFGEHPPIERATLLRIQGGPITRDLADYEINQAFEFADLLAFCGLARRKLFRHGPYVNRDSFSLVIQAYQETGSGGVSVRSRRRDGSTLNYFPADMYRLIRPAHVQPARREPDVVLLEALLNAADSARAASYDEAIFSFTSANTDSPWYREQHELVALVGAFERLLDANHANVDDLALRLVNLVGRYLLPVVRPARLRRLVALERTLRTDRVVESACFTEAWMRDLYRFRNDFGHGRRRSKKRTLWPSAAAHLVLGAYFFPLTVLVRLSQDGLYSLSGDDRRAIRAFEYLASLRNPFRARRLFGDAVWNAALSAADNAERYAAVLRAWEGGPPAAPSSDPVARARREGAERARHRRRAGGPGKGTGVDLGAPQLHKHLITRVI